MATTKILAIFTIILVVAEIVPALSDSVPVPQNDVSKLEQTMDHQNVYSRVKRQFSSYPNGRRNTPVPIIFGGGGFGGNNGGRGFGGMGFGGRGFGAGGGGFGGARGGFGGARGGFGGARGGFGGGGRGRG